MLNVTALVCVLILLALKLFQFKLLLEAAADFYGREVFCRFLLVPPFLHTGEIELT